MVLKAFFMSSESAMWLGFWSNRRRTEWTTLSRPPGTPSPNCEPEMKCSVSLGRKAFTMHLAGIFSRVSPRVTGRTSSLSTAFRMGTRYEESRQSRIFGGTRALAMSVKNFERTVLSEGGRSVWRMDCRWSVRKPDGPGPLKRGAFRKTSSRSSQGISIGSVGLAGI